MEAWFGSRVVRQLLKLLAKPSSYDDSTAVGIVLKAIARYYAVSLRVLRAAGTTTTTSSPAEVVSAEVHHDIMKGEITTKHEVEDSASLKLDRRLVDYGKTSLVAAERMENFFHLTFTNLVEKDKRVKAWCRDPELLDIAFGEAFLGFLTVVRKEKEVLRSGGRNLFFEILRNKCLTEIDRAGKRKKRIAQYHEDQIKSQLPNYNWSAPPEVDLVLEKEDLELLRNGEERCYRLLNCILLGWKNKDLAKFYGTSIGAITERISQCRKKMWIKHQALNKGS